MRAGTLTSPSPTRARSRSSGRLAKSTSPNYGDSGKPYLPRSRTIGLATGSNAGPVEPAGAGMLEDMNVSYDAEHVFASQHPPAGATPAELALVAEARVSDSVTHQLKGALMSMATWFTSQPKRSRPPERPDMYERHRSPRMPPAQARAYTFASCRPHDRALSYPRDELNDQESKLTSLPGGGSNVADLVPIDAFDPRAQRAIAYLRPHSRMGPEQLSRGFLVMLRNVSVPIIVRWTHRDSDIRVRELENRGRPRLHRGTGRNMGGKRAWPRCRVTRCGFCVSHQRLSVGNFRYPATRSERGEVAGPGRLHALDSIGWHCGGFDDGFIEAVCRRRFQARRPGERSARCPLPTKIQTPERSR